LQIQQPGELQGTHPVCLRKAVGKSICASLVASHHEIHWHVAAPRSAAPHSTAQHSIAQHSTAQHSTAQHGARKLPA